MRVAAISAIHDLMKTDKKIYFLTGDLGFHTLEEIEADFPERFINIGIAEQNMIGIASGLAMSGKKVYVYSIIPFLTMRCFEQIRNDICFHNLDVTLVGAGAGLTYGVLSTTHFALEDVAILRSLPNMTIFSPADETEAVLGIRNLKNHHQPTYIRIGKKKEAEIYKKPYKFVFGQGRTISEGKDAAIFASGPILNEVLLASDILKNKFRINPSIINIHTIKPLDKNIIIKNSLNKRVIFTVEEHSVIGGLGSAVCEVVSEFVARVRVIRIGVEENSIKFTGTQKYLREKIGLNAQGIVNRISHCL